MKLQSLGRTTSAANGITISTATNATPIVATIGAGHGLKNGDRIAISGVTTLTAANGIWTLGSVGATTGTLLGSAGNGAFGGTAAVAVVFDKTPFMRGHSAVAVIGNASGSAVFVGTALVEGSNQSDADWTSSAAYVDAATTIDVTDGVGSDGSTGQVAVPAATAGLGEVREVQMHRFMRFRASAYTSGGAVCSLLV